MVVELINKDKEWLLPPIISDLIDLIHINIFYHKLLKHKDIVDLKVEVNKKMLLEIILILDQLLLDIKINPLKANILINSIKINKLLI